MTAVIEYPEESIQRYRIGCQQSIVHGRFNIRHVESLEQRVISRQPMLTHAQDRIADRLIERLRSGDTTMLGGPAGVGKTYLATYFGIDWNIYMSREHGKAKYFTLSELFEQQKEWYNLKNGKPAPLRVAKDCGLLVLDEITGANDTAFDQRELRELVDARYRNRRPLLMLTNRTPRSLRDVFDEPTVDRLFENNVGILELTGPSHRQGATR